MNELDFKSLGFQAISELRLYIISLNKFHDFTKYRHYLQKRNEKQEIKSCDTQSSEWNFKFSSCSVDVI